MLGILKLYGMEINSLNNFSENIDFANSSIFLMGVAISHIFMFMGSGLLFWKITCNKPIQQYFCFDKPIHIKLFFLFILLLFMSYPLIGASGLINEYIEFPEWVKSMDSDYEESMTKILAGKSLWKLSLNLLVIALIPAIGEEMIFRGIIQKELQVIIENPHVVIFLTGILFSGVHLQATGFFPKLFISYILCYSFHWTRNLRYPIILHFLNNATMILALYFGQDQIEMLEKNKTPDFPWGGVVISLFLCTVIVTKILNFLSDNSALQKDLSTNE